MSDEFPADLRQFIIDYFDSVAELEVLLLLRNSPDKLWAAADVSKALRAATDVSGEQLALLRNRRFLRQDEGGFGYSPATPELQHLVDRLADIYKARHVSVITLIYSKPVDKVQTFADAFKLRKDK